MAMFLRVLDQVIYTFKAEIFGILDTLLTPLLQRVFATLAEPTTGTDDEIQLAELRREYLNFILIILNQDLGSVLVSNGMQLHCLLNAQLSE
jgi:exportin-T